MNDLNRRAFLQRGGVSFGALALASLARPNIAHGRPRVKRIIHLCMAGGPSHVDTFDHKPKLNEIDGQPFPESVAGGLRFQSGQLKARGSFSEFKNYGKSGQEISTRFPHTGSIADDICIIKSMHTDQINHGPAQSLMNTGSIFKGRPSIGSQFFDVLNCGEAASSERIQEPQHVLDLYGIKEPGDGSFASNCLMARRLAERGSRFIRIHHDGWDHHRDIEKNLCRSARETDQASAALVKDLKDRGMLDDTLVVWGGEFGRTPMAQGSGRDHHIDAFSIWLAGGGINGGTSFGNTDELGYHAIDDGEKVHVHDLHATILHLCGLNQAGDVGTIKSAIIA